MEKKIGDTDAAISARLTVYEKIVRILLYAVVALVPLFYLPWTAGVLEYNKQTLLIVVAAAGLVVWLLGAVVNGKLTIRTSPLDKGVLALLVASLIATVFSLTSARSVFGTSAGASSAFLTVLALSLFYFLVVNTFHEHGRALRSVFMVSLACTLLVGLLQMMGWYIVPGAFMHARGLTTVGSLNVLGVLAAIMLPLFVKMSFRGSGRWITGLSLVSVAIAVAVLAILNWWVLWVIALAGMLAMIAFDSLNVTQLSEDYGGRKNRFALSRFVVPMVVVVVGGFFLLVNIRFGVRESFPVEIAPSQSLSWHVAMNALRHRPIAGWGPENFSLAFDAFGAGQLANSQLAGVRFSDATSEVLTIAVQGGVLMLLALAFLMWCIAQVVARFGGVISESVARGERAILAARSSGTLAATVAMTIALFLYPFNIALWFVFFVLLALSALIVSGNGSRTVDIEERPMYSLAASLGFIVGLIVVLTGVYLVSVRYLADVRYAQAVQEAGTPVAALDRIGSAINLDTSNDRYLRDASQLALVALRDEINKKDTSTAHTQRMQDLMSSSIQLAQRATTVQPLESLNWSNLGQVYQALTGLVSNVEQLSADAYTKGATLRPGDPTFDNSIGQMWLARSDLVRSVIQQSSGDTSALQKQVDDSLTKAEAAFKHAITLSDTYGLAIYNLGAVYERQNKVPEAIAQLEKIAPYNSNEPTLMFQLGLLYVRAGRKDDARAAFGQAVLLAPQYANARWYLALLLEDKGDIAGALLQLLEIQKTNPDNAALQQKISQLQQGQRAIPPGKVIDSKPLQ